MKSGFAALIGSSNAGKSTLLNALLGEKVTIVSHKAQTTRENIIGVYNCDRSQIAFIDTPGLYKQQTGLGEYMTRCVDTAAASVDVIVLLTDAEKGIRERELKNIDTLTATGTPVIVAINKIDLVEKRTLLPMLEKLAKIEGVVAAVPISAKKESNLDALVREIETCLKSEYPLYPEDVLTDKSDRFMVSELIREKILNRYNQEIPHGVCVSINKFERSGELYDIDADIICEKKGHKSIIIGKGGQALKAVASEARKDMERLLERKVFLTLWVRVKENWRDRPELLSEFGFDKKQLT